MRWWDSAAVRRMLEKIAGIALARRGDALQRLPVLAGLRRLETIVEQEVRKMPILNNILDNKVLGREFKKGLADGVEQGAWQEALALLRGLLESALAPRAASKTCYPSPSSRCHHAFHTRRR